jgi:hypothetical protein
MRKADKFQENELRIKIIETQIKNLKILIFPNPKHIYVSKGLVTNSYHIPQGGGCNAKEFRTNEGKKIQN